MIKKIAIGFAAVLVAIIVIAATRPNQFRIERSAVIAASPMELYSRVNDHRKLMEWNPFAKVDPNCKNTFFGPNAGVGSACSWNGNSEAGEGTSTIIESKPGELVRMRMDFKRPMENTATVDFTFEPEAQGTKVTWAIYGRQLFIGKVMSLFMDCDKLCGSQFEKGFQNLKEIVESDAQPKSSTGISPRETGKFISSK